MKIQYANKLILYMGLGGPTVCVYQLFFNSNDSNDTKMIQYFIMHGLGLCIKLDSYVAHMFYAWSLNHNTSVPTALKNNNCFIYLNTYTTFFSWGAVNSNKNIT